MSDLDIENICRLCCEKKGRLRSLFEEQPRSESRSLQQIILDVTRLEVQLNDGMPQKVCPTCVTTLVKMHQTIEGFRENDSKLRQQIGGTLPLPLMQIKEEEVDIELLEKTCRQSKVMVENISIKEEEEDVEFLDYEQLNESDEPEQADKDQSIEDKGSETDTADEALQYDEERLSREKSNKKLPKKRKKVPVKKLPKERKKVPVRKLCKENITTGPPKPFRNFRGWRTEEEDPNRPRLRDFKCYICMSDSHGTPEALMAHLHTSHIDLLPYTCPLCVTETVVIQTVGLLNVHKRQHLNPEKCPLCDKRYATKRGVEIHMETHHSTANDPNPSTCEMCGKLCSTKLALKDHMKLHTAGATCEICGKVFKQLSKLKIHIQNRHEKLKNFECNICKKKLSTPSAVRVHIQAYHSNEVFKCSYCPKTFNTTSAHKGHEKKHVENRNYVTQREWREYYTIVPGEEGKKDKLKKCNLCGIVTSNMGTHLGNIHFPSEDYRCTICDTTFKRKRPYEIHMQEHEHGKAHRCPICGDEFSDRKYLINHLRTKKHRDHPMAQKMLATIKTASSVTSNNSNCSDVDSQEAALIDIGIEMDSFM